MVTDEKVLEELYELLGMYFSLSLPGGIVFKECKDSKDVQPQLDRVIFQEHVLAKISKLIIDNL